MDAQALAEVNDIINHFEPDIYKKIPKNFINFVQQNKDNNYTTKIDFSKSINEQNILKETKVLLAIIYRDFICDAKLKQKLKEYDFKIIEAKKREIYNPDNLFKNKKEQIDKTSISQSQETTTTLVEYKESIFTKIIKFIKDFFKKG